MKAIRIHAFGGPENLQLDDIDKPVPGPGEVLIRNRAAGVNPIDWKTCSGGGASAFIESLPFCPGWEFAGTIESLGEGVTAFRAGEEVLGFVNFPKETGCYAEYLIAPADQIAHRPAALDPQSAAGLGLAGLTAWQALFEEGQLKPGQSVLVLAAAGGVGHLAVQLAKWKGAYVIGTASSGNKSFLQSLGCDDVIDYGRQQVENLIHDVDLIIDGVGGETAIRALACLTPQGRMVTLPSVTAAEVIAAGEAQGLNVSGIRARPDGQQLQELAKLASSGKVLLNLADSLPLSEAARAHQLSAKGHIRGKLVLTI
ncbi:NADP-dependent oxidoreductase [Marinobacterium sediminicola]|uniref:NADPH:quinone reductase n=1 Tax=Marinobacterium sediminicola TaxID=518898 RepID=A0ABY1RZB8_9GAMM|nr:NADP-dependent oxidoreductase [Marinobacterium sediminicola]ULG69131.1 NADP-dependent oxidoreductase [Marinobacterium sediminicola]SMR73588.1 NADPH:quinone reductase [Marinobacterium sediminicola]